MTELVALAGIAVVAAVVLVVIPWCVITERRSRPCTECRRRAVESVTPTPIASPVEVRPGVWDFPASSPASSGGPGGWRRDDRGTAFHGTGFVVMVALTLVLLGFLANKHPEKAESAANTANETAQNAVEAVIKGDVSYLTGGPDQLGKVTPQRLRAALDRAAVVERHPSGDDYDRDAFGTDWTEDPSGCDTRQRVLARDLTDVRYTDTSRCEVASGDLDDDPYTGSDIAFSRDDAYAVQIDHVVPLGYAWRAGAASWSEARRVSFANDTRNLLAVDGPANASKSDAGPGEWMPTNEAYGCAYLARFLGVVNRYNLTITHADAAVVREWAPRCARGNGGNAGR